MKVLTPEINKNIPAEERSIKERVMIFKVEFVPFIIHQSRRCTHTIKTMLKPRKISIAFNRFIKIRNSCFYDYLKSNSLDYCLSKFLLTP